MGAGYDPCPLCGDEDDFHIIQQFGKCRDCVHRELDAATSKAICELADDDNEAEHDCGWVVCGVCLNNAALAHKKVADVLQQEVNRLHTECGHREADCVELRAECERLQADLGHGRDERVKLRDELAAARKFIGELTSQVQRCQHYDDELAAARALLREAVDDPTCAFGDPWRSNARAAGGGE